MSVSARNWMERQRSRRSNTRRESGMVMLVVMLILLVGTTIASMTVHAISLEIRSAGYYRQQAQTHYVAESALVAALSLQPRNITDQIRETFRTPPVSEGTPDLANSRQMRHYGEPDPGLVLDGRGVRVGRRIYRMPWGVLDASLNAAGGGAPAVDTGPLGSVGAQAFTPWYIVDFTDFYDEDAPVAGLDASGNATFKYVHATVTVRGRTSVGAGGFPDANRGGGESAGGTIFQQATDNAYDMRATVQLGPVPR